MKKLIVVIVSALTLFCAKAEASPTYGFVNITNKNPGDAVIGEAQLFVELFDLITQVKFHFTNTGPEASSITQVYFDDGVLSGIASIDNSSPGSPGVSFHHPETSPPDLPGGNTVGFMVTTGFSAGSDSPVEHNGVNPGEYLGITFDLQNGGVFQDVLDNITSGDLRIGIHVQGFDSGGSESFINDPNPINGGNGNGNHCVIPAPSAILLGSIGASFVGWFRRRRTL